MADVEFDDFEGGYAASHGGRFGRMAQLAGAACSVALMLGLAVWGYKLAVRDVSGIPVIRAMEGPLRMSPENPGGEVVMHQGLSVNAIAAAGTASEVPQSLTLAPKGADLAPEDAPGLAVLAALPENAPELTAGNVMASAELPEMAPIEEPVEIAAAPVVEEPVAEVLPATQEDAVALALAAALADGGEPLSPLADAPLSDSLEADMPALALAVSPRPKARPVLAEASADAELADVQDVAAVAPVEVDASTIAAGTRLVQLGAFDDEPAARGEWATLQGRFAELMAGKAMVVQAATSGGRTFYRLRAHGFEGEDEARRFCAALLAENASCIPVAQR